MIFAFYDDEHDDTVGWWGDERMVAVAYEISDEPEEEEVQCLERC